MSSSRSYLTRRKELEVCASKIKYLDEGAARKAARATGPTCRVYRCPGPKGKPRHFHVTSGGSKWRAILDWTPE